MPTGFAGAILPGVLYEKIIRPLIFATCPDAETAHERGMRALGVLHAHARFVRAVATRLATRDPRLERTVMGLRFPNPVGLAGGFDKNAVAPRAFEALGFGFIELGTITRHPQPGNPRPRVFRFPENEAILNRFGFNNDGAEAMARRLAACGPLGIPVGISLGKSKITPLEDAADDYLFSLRALHDLGDYFAVNVSSPNTPNLRALQDGAALDALLAALVAETRAQAARSLRAAPPKPIVVKVAPDLTLSALDEVLAVCAARGVAGIVATNTTLAREGLTRPTAEEGGLSGRPLSQRSRAMVAHIAKNAPALALIGVGGIMTPDDAARMLDAGAHLLQVYTGFVYRGPFFPRDINRHLLQTFG